LEALEGRGHVRVGIHGGILRAAGRDAGAGGPEQVAPQGGTGNVVAGR